MNLGELEAELALYVQDDSLATHFKSWINSSVTEIANDFFLPALRLNEPTSYKKPTDLSLNTDELTCIPSQYHARVVIPKVVIIGYHLLMDMAVNPPEKSLQWWIGKYRAGLYGEIGGDIGMLNCLARDKGVRRTGGRDPIP
jgi:hypothetical protein